MTQIPDIAEFSATSSEGGQVRVGVVDGAVGSAQQLASIAAQFPHVEFERLGPEWPEYLRAGFAVLIAAADAAVDGDVDNALRRVRAQGAAVRTVVMLRNADVSSTRRLIREGCASVVPYPATEAAIAVALDGLLASIGAAAEDEAPRGQAIAFLKAGGGVGASSLVAQLGALMAGRGQDVCLLDLDLQFGAMGAYLDMPEAMTLGDVVSAGSGLQDVSLKATLARHRSGASVVPGPRQLMPLEALTPQVVEGLLPAFKSEFDVTLVDMPSVWTAWTNRVLQMVDHIVVVTQLTVPHLQMVDRQFQVLRAQGFDTTKVSLVVNGLSAEQAGSLSVKAAERALGRSVSATLPEDRKVMLAAVNQGLAVSAVKRGTKLEKALTELANRLAPVAAEPHARKRR